MNARISDRRVLLGLMAAGSLAAAPLALELPPWVLAVFIAGMAWRYFHERFQRFRPGGVVRTALMLLIVAAVYRQFHSLLGRDPGMALLVALLGLKFLEIKTARDFIISLFLFYLVILGGFLYSQSLWLGAWALLSVTVSTAALLHIMQPTGLDQRQRLHLSGAMLARALPLMVIVYLLFPRISGTLWGLPTDAYAGLTGMPDVMQPGNIRSLSESSEVAFRVNFDGAPPPARALYWRGLVLTETDGQSWRQGTERAASKVSFFPQGPPVTYHVILEPSNKPWMPALDLPATRPRDARYLPDFSIRHDEPVNERLSYTLTSYTRYRTGALDETEREHDLQLPAKLSPRVRALALEWRRQDAAPLQIAQAALNYFHRENFVYTLHPPLLGDDPVDEFLFDTRRGFCEHYASAFVTLMRVAGIPSRVVVGYLGGELNTAGNYMIVRQSDAHAWAEIWTPQRGWVRVDPTGVVAPERIELGLDAVRRLEQEGVALGSLPEAAVLRVLRLGWLDNIARHARWYWDYTNLTWYRWVVDYGQERQERFLASLGLDDISWGRLLSLLTAGVLLVTLGYASFLLRPKKTTDPALALYRRFCRQLTRAGLVREPYEGAVDFARRCKHRRPDLKERIEIITRYYVDTRYGKSNNANQLHALRSAVMSFRI
ncbi:MAG: transglutaminase TgpA family protein [Sulfuricaulis sp.]